MLRQQPVKPEISLHAGGGSRFSIVISIIALAISVLSLYETLLKQPRLSLNTAAAWQYSRSEASGDEEITVPLSIINDGAREAVVLTLTLTLQSQNGARIFKGLYTSAAGASSDRLLLPPVRVSGKSAYTGIIVFTPEKRQEPVVSASGGYKAQLDIVSTHARTYGFLDRLTASEPESLKMSMRVHDFSLSSLIGSRSPLPVSVTEINSPHP
jgi:hypothetical protein